MVVEDEYRIRKGVIKLLGRIKAEYEVVGEAENGLAGLEVISVCKPDLVIVDIKMPFMDGLDMLYKLKESGIKHKTIILSGYSDFEFAQQAIKIGVSEYLLKPVTVNDLEQTLKNIEKELEMERILKLTQVDGFNSVEAIFQNIVTGNNDKRGEMLHFLSDKYGIDADGEFAAVSVYYGRNSKYDSSSLITVLSDIVSTLKLDGFAVFELALHYEIIILIYNHPDYQFVERLFQNIVIKETMRRNFNNLVFGWIRFTGLSNMKNSISIIRKELKWSIVIGEDILIAYPKTNQINTKLIQYPIEIESAARAAVFSSDLVRLKKLFNDFQSWWQKDLYNPTGVIEAFVRFVSSIINVIKETDFEIFEAINQKETLQSIIDSTTKDELHEAMYCILNKLALKAGNKTQNFSLTVKRAISFVNEFYKDGITLDQTAARLNITPEYLSSIFNKEVGANFSSYIKDYRIKKAKELLINSNLKAYEISEQVGYSDPKYFSRVFREVTGYTPGEYQKAYK